MKHAPMISRSLIALLFVVAGFQKLLGFEGFVGYLGSLGVPMASVVAVVVIFIEIVVALAFAYGYKVCTAGWILVGFTALATIIAHRDFAAGANMVMALKNIAIIGGIWASVLACTCGTCPASKGKK